MYGLVTEGEPFHVFARRENGQSNTLVLRFECKEGMGILGIRKSGRTDPAPSAAYEEEEIDPAALRAGRFVHLLPSGQRQSYALSRLSAEVTNRMPVDRWLELRPLTEYGFRYLIAPDTDLDGTVASVQVTPAPAPRGDSGPDSIPQFELPPVAVKEPTGPIPPLREAPPAATPAGAREPVRNPVRTVPTSMPPPQTPMAPAIADTALRMIPKEAAIEQLKAEMLKVHVLQQRVAALEEDLRRSRSRERDLIELLSKWES